MTPATAAATVASAPAPVPEAPPIPHPVPADQHRPDEHPLPVVPDHSVPEPLRSNGTSENAAVRARPPIAPVPRPNQPAQGRPTVQIRGDASRAGAAAPPRRGAPPQRRGIGRLALTFLALAVVIVAVVAVLLFATSGGGGTKTVAAPQTPTTNAPVTHHRATPAPLSNGNVTVTVLNGTVRAGFAAAISRKLTSAGFKPGTAVNAADQTRTATVVAYITPSQKPAALAVAAALKLGSASVQQIDPATQAVACPPGKPCTANVVVTLGSDLSATP
jgi:hypothetical protein